MKHSPVNTRNPSLLFEIELEPGSRGSRAGNLRDQLKAAIESGRLAPGMRLPSSRDARKLFGVARNTMAEVYEQLLNQGYVVARQGSGTFVADTLPRAQQQATSAHSPARRLNPFWLQPEVAAAIGFWRDPSPHSPTNATASIDLRPALVDARMFPFDVLRRVSSKQLRLLERKTARNKSPQGNQGNYHLRQAITNHIAVTRAVACHCDDVLVTSGAQQAFDLLARVLVASGDTVVAVEDPGYPPMRVAFAAAGAKLVPVGIDTEGLIVDAIPANASVICLCPSHQFPIGVSMSALRRQALIEFARRHNAVIVEDDYDGEFRFDGSPLTALRGHEASDVVFYVGTLSKCMLPSLRLGFIIAPDWARRALVAAKNCLDWHCSMPIQLGVAGFIAEGHLARHVRKMRRVYQQRRQLLVQILNQDFSRYLQAIPSCYGIHISATAATELDLERATEKLARNQVQLHTFSRYYLGPQTRRGLVFGLGAAHQTDLRRALAALHNALRGR
jgi:GntR family transcriptional regulator/MocR family aminotransferase